MHLRRVAALRRLAARYAAGLHSQSCDVDEILCTAPDIAKLRIDEAAGSAHLGASPRLPLPSTRIQPNAAPKVLLLTRKAIMRLSRGSPLFHMRTATSVSLHLRLPQPPCEQRD